MRLTAFQLSDWSPACRLSIHVTAPPPALSPRAALVANHRDAAVNTNGMYVVVNPDGTHSSWIG